jgi:chromosome segregation ATPase
MEKNELLLELSQLIDKKNETLQTNLTSQLDTKFSKLEQQIESRFVGIDLRLDAMDQRLDAMDQRFDGIDLRLDKVDKRLDKMDKRFIKLEKTVNGLDARVKYNTIILETEILPRITNLEECYTSTYKRYRDGVDNINKIAENVGIMETVIKKHSHRILQRYNYGSCARGNRTRRPARTYPPNYKIPRSVFAFYGNGSGKRRHFGSRQSKRLGKS